MLTPQGQYKNPKKIIAKTELYSKTIKKVRSSLLSFLGHCTYVQLHREFDICFG